MNLIFIPNDDDRIYNVFIALNWIRWKINNEIFDWVFFLGRGTTNLYRFTIFVLYLRSSHHLFSIKSSLFLVVFNFALGLITYFITSYALLLLSLKLTVPFFFSGSLLLYVFLFYYWVKEKKKIKFWTFKFFILTVWASKPKRYCPQINGFYNF